MPFSSFPTIYLPAIWKFYAIFDILKEADWMLFQASADNSCYETTILLYISWKYKYWCILKGLSDEAKI